MRIINKDKKKKTATMLFYKEISRWNNSDWFANILANLEEEGCKTLYVRMNCKGGDVIEGNAMFNAIRSTKIKVIAMIDGVAASMGGVLLLAFDDVWVAANGRGMFHGVRGGAYGTATQLRASADLMDSMNDDFVRELVARTPFSEDEIKEKLKSDWWISAKDLVKYGVASKIYNGVVKKEVPDTDDIQAVYQHYQTELVAAWDENSLNQNVEKMYTKEFKASIGLGAEATDQEVVIKVAEFKAQAEAFKNQMEARKKTLIDGAIVAKKITATDRVIYETMTVAQLEAVFGSIQPQINPQAIIEQGQVRIPNTGDGNEFHPKSWDELVALGNDVLESYKKKHGSKYAMLYKAEFGFDYRKDETSFSLN